MTAHSAELLTLLEGLVRAVVRRTFFRVDISCVSVVVE